MLVLRQFLKKNSACDNYPNPSCLTKINKDIACGFSVFVKYSYDNSTNDQNFYRGEDSLMVFWRFFGEWYFIESNQHKT